MRLEHKVFNITPILSNSKDLFTFALSHESKKIGQIIVRRGNTVKERGVLDIFIIPKYRCRWLTITFAKQIFKSVVSILKKNEITIVISKALHTNSPRLLEFFGFKIYNTNKCYYLKI